MKPAPDYSFTLPWPPTLNHYRTSLIFRSKNSGKEYSKLVTSKKGREYSQRVGHNIIDLGLNNEAINQPLYIGLYMHPPTANLFDCSNFLKAYEDALVRAGFLVDDHWIQYAYTLKGEKVKGGLLRVSAWFENPWESLISNKIENIDSF